MNKPNENLKAYWTGLSSANPGTRLRVFGQEDAEFAPNQGEIVIRGEASRRKFLGLLGASTALAGITSTGCIRKPRENIMPFAKRPEDLIPGKPVFFATAAQLGPTVQGLLVESYDGRPIKVEGNPQHPGSGGATDVFAQALILGLYDPHRSAKPMSRTVGATVPAAQKAASADQAKAAGIKVLAQEAYDRTLKATHSIDAANKARADFEAVAQQKASVRTVKGEGGDDYAVTVAGNELTEVSWPTAWSTFDDLATAINASGGEKLALVIPDTMSPSLRWRIGELSKRLPKAAVYISDPGAAMHTAKAAELLAGPAARTYYSLNNAQVIFAADSDFLGVDADHTRLSGEFAKNRQISQPGDPMSRLYVAEAHLSVTGGAADHRLRARSSEIGDILKALVRHLVDDHKLAVPSGSEALVAAIKAPTFADEATKKFVRVLAKDLAEKKDKGVVLVGERQAVGVHGLGLLVNALLGSLGRGAGAQRLRSVEPVLNANSLSELASAIDQGTVTKVICIATNPVYTSPGTLGFAAKFPKLELVIHLGQYFDETAQFAHLHLPLAHELETWGDLEAADGTRSICQPLIAPLHDAPSALEFIERLGQPATNPQGHEIVKAYWTRELGDRGLSDKQWRRWLHDGVINEGLRVRSVPSPTGWDQLSPAIASLGAGEGKNFEINYHLDPKLYAGEFASNAWMQECPHPMTKLVWDNAAYLSEATAAELKVKNGDFVAIKVGERSVSLPVWIAYGQADRTVSVTLGYGRTHAGPVGEGAGFDINPLRSAEKPHFDEGDVSRGSGSYLLVSTQDYGQLDPDGKDGIGFLNYEERPIYRETTTEGFKKDKDFTKKGDLIAPQNLKPLWERPKLTGAQQWGMSVDLNLCTGCNACVVACQAENNIATVGKKECSNGREMHWIRLDRYYRGDMGDPQSVIMPMLCQHCETAPCENVCPVQATSHSPEGLNDMAYNRCVGTRYCANNCPYKVRRFNFFNYNIDMPELLKMSKNPDVTVRFRGVIEKCTFCVQRINAAKIEAHSADKDTVTDGNIVTACQQVCPTGAVVFGDIKDPNTRVSKLKAQSRDYGVLTDLYTVPRVTYLGRVRNPNSELG
jgi:molybdopterin-containing oxidoreductase family iron-sulfur binding subunit